MVCIIAAITLKDGKREKYLEEIQKILPVVHKEAGCIEYRPCTDLNSGIIFQVPYRPDTVTIMEKWESLDALKNHGRSEHMTSFRYAVKEYVQTMQLQVLNPVE
jgi:quinol monooxygenase YgiN